MIPLRDANPTRRTPVVTIGIVAICFAVFAYQLGLLADGGPEALERFVRTWGVVPAALLDAWDWGRLLAEPVLGLITSQFLHGGWLHILGNMLYLWIFGNNIEDAMGKLKFVVFYLLGGVAATLAQYATDTGAAIPNLGASGAIGAVLGGYALLYPRARVVTLIFIVFFITLLELPALLVLGAWFLLQLLDASSQPVGGGGVAVWAHIGGFVFGLIAVKLFASRAQKDYDRHDRLPVY